MQKFIRLPEVKNRTGLSKTTIYEYVQEGRFPASILIGSRAVGWVAEDVDEWIAKRIKQAQKARIKNPKLKLSDLMSGGIKK